MLPPDTRKGALGIGSESAQRCLAHASASRNDGHMTWGKSLRWSPVALSIIRDQDIAAIMIVLVTPLV